MMTNIKNRWILITGAASGIGFETAQAFAQAGANIIATDLSLDMLERIKYAVEGLGQQIITAELNVTESEQFSALLTKLDNEGVEVDVLVNNAGVAWIGSVEEQDASIWKRVLDINVMGVVNGVQAVLPRFKQSSQPKHIVNVASVAAIAPPGNLSAYAASKAAVMGFTDTLAVECLGSNVHVTCVHPGVINTPIVNASSHGASISESQLCRLQDYYVKKGVLPSVVANDIVRAVQSRKARLFTGAGASSAALLKRLLPSAWFWLLAKKLCTDVGYLPTQEEAAKHAK